MKNVHHKCYVFRGNMYAKLWCDHLFMCSQLTIWDFGWWRTAACWAWSLTEVQARKRPYLNCFDCLFLVPSAWGLWKVSFGCSEKQLQLFKASYLWPSAPLIGIKEESIFFLKTVSFSLVGWWKPPLLVPCGDALDNET